MKKGIPILFLYLITFANALMSQPCNFTHSSNPGINIVTFYPNFNYPQNLYHMFWDFGDGTSQQSYAATHMCDTIPRLVCCNVLDTANNVVCTACDSTHFISASCDFWYTSATGTDSFLFVSGNTSGNLVRWNFGDGSSGTGSTVTHTYAGNGTYSICMWDEDSLSQDVLCQKCEWMQALGLPSCNFMVSQNTFTGFDFYAPDSNATVSWDFGDNTSDTGIHALHTYASQGNYFICMHSVDTNQVICDYCDSLHVGTGLGTCSMAGSVNPSNWNLFQIVAQPLHIASHFSWDLGDGTLDTGTIIHHTYVNAGNYNVCMDEIDSTNTVICNSCSTFVVQANLICNFSYGIDQANHLIANFSSTIFGGGLTVDWDFGDNSQGTGTSTSHTYSHVGLYHVNMIVRSFGNFVCTSSKWIMTGSIAGTCAIWYIHDSANANSYNFFEQCVSAGSTIDWDFGDGTTGTGENVQHTYANQGSYSVCATENDSNQVPICQNCVNLIAGAGCQAAFIVASTGLTSYFIDQSVVDSLTYYDWNFGDGASSSTRFPQHTYSNPGTYWVCLTTNDNSCNSQYCDSIVVDTLTGSSACHAAFAIVGVSPYQVSVINLSTGTNLSYNWSFGDGASDTAQFPTHYYANTGSYYLCLTVTDTTTCTDTYCDTLNVDSLGGVFHLSQAGFTMTVLSPSQITSVEDNFIQKSIVVYPNPVTSELQMIFSPGESALSYRLFTVQGVEFRRGDLRESKASINVQDLNAGIYLLELIFSDQSVNYKYIIKNR